MLAFALATAPSKAICNRKIPLMFYQQSKFRAKSKESASHPTSATDRLSAASINLEPKPADRPQVMLLGFNYCLRAPESGS